MKMWLRAMGLGACVAAGAIAYMYRKWHKHSSEAA